MEKQKPAPEPEKTILQEAQEVVYSDRVKDGYGDVTSNFNTTAKLWSAILDTAVSPEQVGLCMIAFKLARQKMKYKKDSLVDICGYAATLEKLHKGL